LPVAVYGDFLKALLLIGDVGNIGS